MTRGTLVFDMPSIASPDRFIDLAGLDEDEAAAYAHIMRSAIPTNSPSLNYGLGPEPVLSDRDRRLVPAYLRRIVSATRISGKVTPELLDAARLCGATWYAEYATARATAELRAELGEAADEVLFAERPETLQTRTAEIIAWIIQERFSK